MKKSSDQEHKPTFALLLENTTSLQVDLAHARLRWLVLDLRERMQHAKAKDLVLGWDLPVYYVDVFENG